MSQYLGRIVRPIWIAFAVALVSLLFVAASPAAAAGKHGGESRQSQERAARKACLTGDYAKGVAILSDLFIELRDRTFLFNQGRCFEQNRRYEDAIARFEEYLTAPGAKLSGEDRAEAAQRIANCKEKLQEERASSSTTAPQVFAPAAPPVARSIAPQAEPTPESTPATATVVRSEASPSRDGSGLRVTGIVLASVGVAALAGGVLLNLKANSMVDDWQAKVSYTASQSDSQKTYKALSWVGYGLGAACVATGAILFGVGLKQQAGSANVALLPAVGPGQAGALLMGGF
jgi:tetratricopeptide (TPR) repeat protein